MWTKDRHGLTKLRRFMLGKERTALIESFDTHQDKVKKETPLEASDKIRLIREPPVYAHALEIFSFWEVLNMTADELRYALEYWIVTHLDGRGASPIIFE